MNNILFYVFYKGISGEEVESISKDFYLNLTKELSNEVPKKQ